MGMRLIDPRWFRDAAQIEHRLWINGASDADLTKRKNNLEMILEISVLSVESVMELWRIRDADEQRVHERCRVRLRCPRCGGWAVYPPWGTYGFVGVIPLCRDCGWPHADDIYGCNIIVPNPRSGFKLKGIGGEF